MTDDASRITRLMTLYHVRWCPECAIVREKLGELGIPYDDVVVPDLRPLRQEVFSVSGQYYVPVIKDDNTVLTETRDILEYLDAQYSETGDREGRGSR